MAEPANMCPILSCDNEGDQSIDHKSLREKIKDLLGKYDVGSQYTHIPLPKASILLPLLIRQGKPHLLLTVRSMQIMGYIYKQHKRYMTRKELKEWFLPGYNGEEKKLKTMPGDVCFPGGRQEPSDKDDIQTALRETKEEIGLCPEQVHVVGRLIPCIARSPFCMVTPVVGIVEDGFQPMLNRSEVADVFLVPLEFFISTEHYTPIQIPQFGSQIIHKFHYMEADTKKRFTIWGLTAHCALILAVILLEKGPSFDSGFDLESYLRGQEKFIQASLMQYSQSKL